MAAAIDTLEQIRTTIIDLAVKFGPKVLAALVILSIGFLVGRWPRNGWGVRCYT